MTNQEYQERLKKLLEERDRIQSEYNANKSFIDVQNNNNTSLGSKIGYVGKNVGLGAKRSVWDTVTAVPQSYAVGLQRGAKQAEQEQSTWDKIKNYGKNAIKASMYSAGGIPGVIMYNATIGRKDFLNDLVGTSAQIANNVSQADSTWKKITAVGGGAISKAIQDNNMPLQQLYIGGQQTGQLIGADNSKKASQKIQEFDDKLHEKTDKQAEELAQEGQNYGWLTQKLGEAGQSVGYMAPSIATNLLTGGSTAGQVIGLTQMGLASKANTTREALKQGADLETAERKGVATGTIEAGTELMWGGLDQFRALKGKGALESTIRGNLEAGIKKYIKNGTMKTVAQKLADWGLDVGGEIVEETVSDILGKWIERGTTNPNEDYYTFKDWANTAFTTALSTAVTNAGQRQFNKAKVKAIEGMNKISDKVYNRNQARVQNQESISETERTESNGYKENLQEMMNNLEIPDEIKAQIQPMLDSNATINAEEYKNITNEVKSLVKANTQQQILQVGNTLNQQYMNIDNQLAELNNIKPENFKDQESRKFYAQQINKEFSDNTINNILTMYPENRNGNRTVKQYKEIAKEYGKQMALNGLSFDEVRANTVGAWQYYEPNKNITRYDNKEKKNASFDRLNSQVWSQEVYDSYKDTMKTQLQQQQEVLSTQMNDEVARLQDEEDILIDTIDNLKPKASPKQVARTKKLVEDFAKNRGVNVEYNAEVFKNSNEEGFIKDNGKGDRTIYINPNADPDTILVKLATHEMFHDTIRTEPHDKLTKLVMDKLKTDENYNTYRQSVIEAYQEQLEGKTQAEQDAIIDEEMTAKYLGEYLGDEQFVQQLVNSTNRSTIQKIMDWIDNRLQQIKNVVTGNTEAEYWRKVKENFEKAYNSKYQGKEGTQYSLSTSQKKYLEKTNNNEKLKEREFYSLYSAHKIANTENALNIIKSIQENGYKPSASSFGVDLTPSYHSYTDGKPSINDKYAPKKGDYVLFVPESEVRDDPYSIKPGFKPRDFEVVQVERDYQPYYELYEKAYDKYNNANNNQTTDNQGNKDNSKDLNISNGNARFSQDRLDYIVRGSVSDYDDNYARSYITRITPQQFLDLTTTPEGLQQLESESTELNPKQLKNEQQNIFLRVDMETGRVLGHEGRHRMIALRNAGVNNVDIEIIPQQGTYDVENAKDFNFGLYLIGQSMNNGKKGKNVDFTNPITAVTKNNLDKIKQEYLNNNDNKNDIRYSKKTDFDKALQQDNQGRTLTKEQQEYFKDSKVRNENGNLLELHHGTDADFTVFEHSFIGEDNKDGLGFYFTANKLQFNYDNPKTVYVNITNPAKGEIIDTIIRREEELSETLKDKKKILEQIQAEFGYDGIIDESRGNIVAFNSNQIKNVDNLNPTENPDIRYSKKTDFDKALQKDNQGNTINPGMQEYLKDVSPEELVDGKVPLVYHTTTDETSQFNIFNPVGTPYYRFGDQVVNYYTDSKDMSGSYARSNYKMADTKKLNNIEEAKKYLYDYGRTTGNLLTISQNESGKYVLNQEKQTNNEARKFVNSLSEAEIEQMRDNIFYDKDMEGTPYEYAFSWDKFDKSLQEKFKNVTNKYTGTADLVDLENEIMKYVRQPEGILDNGSINGETIKEYNSEKELLRNIKEDIGKTNWSKNSRIQYQGYVKLTNPYVVDAEARNWNNVNYESNEELDNAISAINNIPDNFYEEIKEIYNNEKNKINDAEKQLQELNSYVETHKDYDFINQINKITILETIQQSDALKNNTNLTEENTTKTTQDIVKQVTNTNDLKEALNYVNKKLKEDSGYQGLSIGQLIEKQRDLTITSRNKYSTNAIDNALEEYFESNSNVAEQFENLESSLGFEEDLTELIGESILQNINTKDYLRTKFINNLSEVSSTTNDIVKQIIESNKKGETNYDGVIIKNVYDYGGKAEGKIKPANVYVTFNSNQFKAQDNMNPTEDPDIRYNKKSTAYDDYLKANNPNRSGVTLGDLKNLPSLQKLPTKETKLPTTKKTQTISSTIEEPTLKVPVPKGNTGTEQKVAKVLSEPITKVKPEQRAWALFKANILDKGAVFEDLSFKAKNRELQAKWDSTLLAEAKGQNAIGQARYEFENGEEKQVSKALTDIIDEVGENSEDFNNYMYHQLNIDRMTLEDRFDIANKPVFGDGIDANYSRQKVAELEKAHPEFKEYAQDVYDYLDTNKKELVDNGVISQETSDRFKEMYPHYVPIARIDTKGLAINVPLDTNRTGVNSPIKRAKGGSQDIQPLFQTMANRTMQTYKASSRNNFGLELKNTLNNLGMFNQLENAVENTDNENIFEYDADKGNLQEGNKYQNPTFTVFENGEKVTYEINQDMYDALKPKNEIFSKWDNTTLMKATRKFNDIRRGILTEYNPAFSITNAIKDAQDVLMNSQHAGKTYAKFGEAYSQILKKGYWYKEYVQNGGSQNSYFTDGDFVKSDSKVKSTLKMPLEAISKVNNVIEMAPRLAEYIASREQGKSIQSAMLDASRVTTNFKAGGDVTKFANRNGATFLNASVQGLQQNIRNIREANAKGLKGYGVLLGKAVIAGLPALILNNLVWKDDDDYEELQDYVKDNYYIIAKVGDHKFLRIPKGRTVAVIQKAVTNMSDFITNKDEIDPDKYSEVIWGDLKDTFELASNNLAPNNPIENNIVSPIVQAVNNKTWYGEDLVPSRLKDKPNEEKYDESTAEISKQISGVLNKIGINTNPMQINYLLDQYGGGVADVFLPMGTPQAENNMLEDKFTTDSVMKSRYPGEFFELKDKLAENRNSSKATDEDELLYKYADNVSGELSDLYKKKREIQNSSLTDKEKKKQIAEVQKQINSKTQQALKDIKEPKVSGDTATIGNSEYIRTLNANSGEYQWNKLTDKTKIQGVSLKTQADYQNRLAKYKQKTGDSQLSDKEEAQIILDGNYSSKDKKAIYIATAGKKDTLYKSVSDNLNIDEYLNYKTANIQGVKDSNGKTINGTKKQAQLNYINENISGYENRLLLMGKDYKLSRSQQQDLAQYIYSQGNAEELFELFDKNFTVRDGTVYYK